MYINDPFKPVQVARIREAPKPDPLNEFFAEYQGGRGHTVGPRQPPAFVAMCRYINGRHTERGPDCPHYREPKGESDG